MKKYIFVLNAIELMNQLMNGKRVEGVLFLDENTGRLTFKAYNRQPRVREKDRMVKKLPWGWVKRSKKKWKTFISVDNDLPLEKVMEQFSDDQDAAMEAIIDYTIIERA